MRTYLTVHENVKASPEYKNVADAVEKLGCKSQASSQPAVEGARSRWLKFGLSFRIAALRAKDMEST